MVFLLVSNVWCLILFQTTELKEFGRSWAADNGRRKWCWVLRVFEDWHKTLYEMICRIQAYLRIKCKRNITLGCNLRNLNSALNYQMKQRATAGVGVDVKQAKVISKLTKIICGSMVI